MVYKASSLIATALALADLTNTSFPTASENRLYINLAFMDVYQQAINNGEKYWYKEQALNVGENILPEDFYQLADIYYGRANNLQRYNKNIRMDRWYDIRNNKIIVHNEYGDLSDLKMEYYPLPQTLDPEEAGDVDLDFPNNIFYHIIALRLAEYYKIKQGGDINGIELLLDDAWSTYFDILSRDINQNITINDVMNNDTYII